MFACRRKTFEGIQQQILFSIIFFRLSDADLAVTTSSSTYTNVSQVTFLSLRKCIVFQVKSCNFAGVLLSTSNGSMSSSYEFIIYGPNMTTNTYIKRNGKQQSFVRPPSSLLSCSVFDWFWTSWSGNQITLGRGNIPNTDPLMTFQDPSPLTINNFGVSSLSPNTANWTIPSEFYSSVNVSSCSSPNLTDSSMPLNGPTDNSFTLNGNSLSYLDTGIDLKDKSWVVFQVKTCSDVWVALSPKPGTFRFNETDLYEVAFDVQILGQMDSMYLIKKNNIQQTGDMYSYMGPGCTNYLWLWVSWIDGIIAMGSGDKIGLNIQSLFNDASSPIAVRYMGIRSGSFTQSYWIIPGCYYMTSSSVINIDSTAVPLVPSTNQPPFSNAPGSTDGPFSAIGMSHAEIVYTSPGFGLSLSNSVGTSDATRETGSSVVVVSNSANSHAFVASSESTDYQLSPSNFATAPVSLESSSPASEGNSGTEGPIENLLPEWFPNMKPGVVAASASVVVPHALVCARRCKADSECTAFVLEKNTAPIDVNCLLYKSPIDFSLLVPDESLTTYLMH